MEPDQPHKPSDEGGEDAAAEQPDENQRAASGNEPPTVLPVVIVPAEAIGASDEETSAPGGESDGRRQASGDRGVPIEPIARTDVLSPDVRQLIDQLRPDNAYQIPMASPIDDLPTPEEGGITMQEALDHFTTLAENRMRELNINQPPAVNRAIETQVGISPGDITDLLHRRDEQHEPSIRQLGDPHQPGAAGRFDRPADPPPSTTTPPSLGDTPEGDAVAMPRLEIFVKLDDARAIAEEDRRKDSQEMAAIVEEICDARIRYAFWVRGNHERAADPSLRGPM